MEKKLKVSEILECINLLKGGSFGDVKIMGFCNEKTISEGIRRISNKTLKKLGESYPSEQFQSLFNLKFEDLVVDASKVFESDEDKEKYLTDEKNSKIKELFESEVTVVFEELPDWAIMNNRLEERKENLSYNYVYLFEKLFLNY